MSTQVKRVLIDPDTRSEVQTAKKPRYELQDEVKDKVLRMIALSFYRMVATKENIAFVNNISWGMQAMNILYTGYTVLRQECQRINSSIRTKATTGTPKITISGNQTIYPIERVTQILTECAGVCGLAFAKTHETDIPCDQWFGIAGPYFNFLTGFSLRWRELRLGHSEFPFSKTNNTSQSYPVAKYGLNKAHHILLEGIRFPPERRSSMVQSLGPMTTLLCFLESPPNYANKFETATVNSLAHIPNIDGILKAIKNQPRANTRTIVELLADIAVITTSRQRQRCFPFPNLFSRACINEEDVRKLTGYNISNGYTITQGGITTNQMRSALSFSGFTSAILYNIASTTQWTLNGDFSDSEAQQLVFHCVWGSYKEDLGILKSITNNSTWYKRDTLGTKFQKANTSSKRVNFTTVKLTYFAKLSSANQTGLLAQGSKQVASVPVFGGVRVRKFGEDFFKYLEEQSPIGTGSLTLQGIESDLSKTLRVLKDQLIGNNGFQNDVGTCKWIKLSENSTIGKLDGSEDVVFSEIRPQETCEYFLG